MRDIGGFVALLLIIFILLYLTVKYVIPFVLLYSAGIVLFFIVAGILMRKGLRHPSHLNSFLRPGFAPVIALLSVVLPTAHAAAVYLLDLSPAWMVIGIINLVLPTVWTARVLLLHMKQASRFLREGHDIEEVIDGSRDRAGLLDLKIELLAAAEASRQAPEAWETAAGVDAGDESDLAGQIGRLTMDMKQLRAGYAEVADTLQSMLDRLKTGENRHGLDCADSLGRFAEFDILWSKISREASAILDERTGFTPAGWD